MGQYFTATDYLLSLPIIELTLFALGILLFDLLLPPDLEMGKRGTALR